MLAELKVRVSNLFKPKINKKSALHVFIDHLGLEEDLPKVDLSNRIVNTSPMFIEQRDDYIRIITRVLSSIDHGIKQTTIREIIENNNINEAYRLLSECHSAIAKIFIERLMQDGEFVDIVDVNTSVNERVRLRNSYFTSLSMLDEIRDDWVLLKHQNALFIPLLNLANVYGLLRIDVRTLAVLNRLFASRLTMEGRYKRFYYDLESLCQKYLHQTL